MWWDEHGNRCGKPAAITTDDGQDRYSYCQECWADADGEPPVAELKEAERKE